MSHIETVVKHFDFIGNFKSGESYGHGHINDTYVVYYENGPHKRYILQKINKNVFKKPDHVMENIDNVSNYLKDKIAQSGGDIYRECLSIIPTKDGSKFFVDGEGNYWRAYFFIENASSYQVVEDPQHLYQSGKAFGMFQFHLKDFPAETLYETIPDFHNTKKRFDALKKAVMDDSFQRADSAQKEIEFAMKRGEECGILIDMIENGLLPIRVTHNDTKFNNVMIDDNTGKAICVVDLDTVMPGLALYDYGDSIRSGTNSAEEDERDLSKVYMNMEFFEQFTKGYLEEAKHFLTLNEIKMLPMSAKIMTYECGIRFLTDYLNGDTYFKTQREGQNLDRARTQFKLVEEMEQNMNQMNDIVKRYS